MCLSLYHANSGVPQASPENKKEDISSREEKEELGGASLNQSSLEKS